MKSLALSIALFAVAGISSAQEVSLFAPLNAPQTKLEPVLTGFKNVAAERQVWKSTPSALHHHAIVGVSCRDGSGTGAVVKMQRGKGCFVITNHHVIEKDGTGGSVYKNLTVTGTGGAVPGTAIYADPRIDLAVVYCNTEVSVGLPVSATMPPYGATLEMCGLGGPTQRIRHFTAKRIQSSYPLSIDAPVVSGDSGGPILYNGAIVGVNFGGAGSSRGIVDEGGNPDWPLVYPCSAKATGPQIAEILTQQCDPYGCQPQIIYQQPQQSQYQYQQPQYQQPQPQQPQNQLQNVPPQQQQPQQPQPQQPVEATQGQLDAIANALLKTMKEDPQFRGRDGLPGERGEAGPKGDPPSQEQMAGVASALYQQMQGDPAFRGADGRDGIDGMDGKDVDAGELVDMVVSQMDMDALSRKVLGRLDPNELSALVLRNMDVNQLAKQLPPIYPQWVDENENVTDALPEGVRLGQTMPMRITVKSIRALVEEVLQEQR